MFTALLAAAAALQTAAPAAQEPGSVRIFGDWAVGCDNGWACEAISLAPEAQGMGDGLSITVRQGGGADGQSRVGIRRLDDDPAAGITLHIDGEPVATAQASPGDELNHFDPDRAQNLIYRLSRGRHAELYDAGDGGMLGEISLNGSYAALLYIEDRQRRAGTVNASVTIGDAPASTVPAPPAVPTIRAMPIAARHGEAVDPLAQNEAVALHVQRECDQFGPDDVENPEEPLRRNDVFVLSDSADLILISCSRGAYNFSDIAFVRRAGRVEPARFDHVFAWGDNRALPLLVNVDWAPETGQLTTYAKGRGIGDCGTLERFVWDGAMFRLIERREMNSCRGSPYWIPVYRANVEWVEP